MFENLFAATVDVKKFIYHMACNKHDTQIAIVENQGIYENIDESIVRIYDVGRSRTDDEKVSIYFVYISVPYEYFFKI